MAKKSKNYTAYIFAFIQTVIAASAQKAFLVPGFPKRFFIYFWILVGMWHCIQWLLSRSENKWVQWIYVIIGINLYNIAWIGFDYYIHRTLTDLIGVKELIVNQFLTAVCTTIIIESINWSKAREKAQIENLRLQSENIEAKFELLKKQVNPEFLYYCLDTLQKMVKSDDPKTEVYILKLADVYRQILKKNKNIVTLKEELDFLETYLFLMNYGREAAIQYEINVSVAALNCKLPIFALQSLMDKCLNHNDFSIENPLYILIFQKDSQSVTITNNLQPKSVVENIDMEQLEMCYIQEGIENGVLIETETFTYSTTLKLF